MADRPPGRPGLAFGEYDMVAIVEQPTNVSAAAFSMAVSAGGTIRRSRPHAADVDEGVGRDRDGARADSAYAPATASENITA